MQILLAFHFGQLNIFQLEWWALICKNQDKFKFANKLKWFGYDRDTVKDRKGMERAEMAKADIKKNEVGYKLI